MERRQLLSGGVIAGMGTALGGVPLGAQPAGALQADDRRVSNSIDELKQTIDKGLQVSPELARIREQQRIFLRANQKFPDYIEIGIGVWESICDWHVRHLLPIQVTRTPDGRYAMAVMLTNLILRPEQSETFVGFGFDLR